MVVVTKTESKLSTKNDSTEDLLVIPLSETESVDEGPTQVLIPTPRNGNQRTRDLVATSSYVCAKGCGKRKRRQYENLVDLLSKGPVDVHIPTIHDFFPYSQRSLITLLEECSIYEAFYYGCEDLFEKYETMKIVHKNSLRKLKFDKGSNSSVLYISSDNHSAPEMKALLRVDESIRCAVINGSIPQDLVINLEAKVIEFFRNSPREIFMSRGLSPLERAALFAICSFHQLTYNCFRKRRYHIAQVKNSNYIFEEPSLHLSSILSKCLSTANGEQLKN